MGQVTARLTLTLAALLTGAAPVCFAGAQQYENLEDAVRARLHSAIADRAAPKLPIADRTEAQQWLNQMSRRLARFIPNERTRNEFLMTLHYEATRAGLDPQLVLGLVQVESNFRKYAVSRAGARGFMQVMPFWTHTIGNKDHNLFNLRTNLRYGCTILRHYLDVEQGNLFRALGRYNGSLGRDEYPKKVEQAWSKTWHYNVRS